MTPYITVIVIYYLNLILHVTTVLVSCCYAYFFFLRLPARSSLPDWCDVFTVQPVPFTDVDEVKTLNISVHMGRIKRKP